MRRPHEVLGVSADATPAQIRTAYKTRAFDLHPDRVKGKEAEWQELQRAYRTLTKGDEPSVSVVSDQFVVNLAAKMSPVLNDAVDAGARMVNERIGKMGGDGLFGQFLRAVGKTVVSESEDWLRGAISEGVKRAQAK